MSWKKCTTCKKPIDYNTKYWVCSVSTCNRKRTNLTFCTVECWDAHVPVLNHRESWAEERRSPTEKIWQEVLAGKIDDPTLPKREKEVVAPEIQSTRAVAAGPPKVILRKKPSS